MASLAGIELYPAAISVDARYYISSTEVGLVVFPGHGPWVKALARWGLSHHQKVRTVLVGMLNATIPYPRGVEPFDLTATLWVIAKNSA